MGLSALSAYDGFGYVRFWHKADHIADMNQNSLRRCPLSGVKRTYTAATSPSDPKQTFRPQILTSIKVKLVAHDLSSFYRRLHQHRRVPWTRGGIICSRAATFVFAA
jgi:hypothetical protein